MSTIVVWLLVVAGSGHSGATVLARFADERSCLVSAADLQQKSMAKPSMAYLYGVCVEAKVLP